MSEGSTNATATLSLGIETKSANEALTAFEQRFATLLAVLKNPAELKVGADAKPIQQVETQIKELQNAATSANATIARLTATNADLKAQLAGTASDVTKSLQQFSTMSAAMSKEDIQNRKTAIKQISAMTQAAAAEEIEARRKIEAEKLRIINTAHAEALNLKKIDQGRQAASYFEEIKAAQDASAKKLSAFQEYNDAVAKAQDAAAKRAAAPATVKAASEASVENARRSMREREVLYAEQYGAEARAQASLAALREKARAQAAIDRQGAIDDAKLNLQSEAAALRTRLNMYQDNLVGEAAAAKNLLELKRRTREQLEVERNGEIADARRALEAQKQIRREEAAAAAFAALPRSKQLGAALTASQALAGNTNPALLSGPAGTSFATQLASSLGGTQGVQAEIDKLTASHKKLTPAIKQSAETQVHWNKVSNEAHALARGLSGSLGTLWLTYGSLAPLIAGAALAGSMKSVVTAGKEVEFQLTFVKAITDGAAVSFSDLSKSMEGSLFTPIEATKGLRTLAQAGLSAQEALAALPNVLKLATVGETDMANAALSATAIMHTFSLSVNDIGHIGDVFGKAAAISATSVREMMEAMKQAAAISSVFGVSMEETAAALATLANRGIEGSAAGTAVRNMVKELASPATKKAADAMKQVGIEIFNADGSAKGFTENLQQLADAVSSMDARSKAGFLEDLFNERGAKAAAILLQDLDKMKRSLNDIKLASNGLGFMTEASIMLSQSVEGMSKQLQSAFQTTLVEAFSAVEPEIKAVLSSLAELVQSSGFKEFLKDTAELVAGLTRFLVEHKDAVLVVATSYLGYQAASLAVSALAASWKYYSTVVAGAAAVTASANAAIVGPVAAGSVAAATTAVTGYSASLMGAVTAGLRFIPVIGTLTAAGWAASKAFDSTSEAMEEYLHSVEGVVGANARLAESTAKAVEQAWREAEAYSEQVKNIGKVGEALKDLSVTKLEIERDEVQRNIRGLEVVKQFDDAEIANDPSLARGGSRSESENRTSSAIAAALAKEKATLASLGDSILITKGLAEIRKTNDEEAAGRKKIDEINKAINKTLEAGVRAQEKINIGIKDATVLKKNQEAVDRAAELRRRLGGKDGKIADLDAENFRKPGVLEDAEDRKTILNDIGVKYRRAGKDNKSGGGKVASEFEAERIAAREWAEALVELGKIADNTEAKTQNWSKAQKTINNLVASASWDKLSVEAKTAALAQYDAALAGEALADQQKVFAEMAQGQADYVKSQRDANKTLDEAIAASKLELDAIGKTTLAKEELSAQSHEQQAALADEAAAVYDLARSYALLTNSDGVDLYQSLKEQSEKRAAKLRELAAIDRDKGIAKASVEANKQAEAAAKKAAEESRKQWNKLADDIEKALSDSLYAAFESGKGFAQSLAESIEAAFKKMVIKIGVDAVVNPVMNGVRGALGVSSDGPGLNIPGLNFNDFAMSGVGESLGLSGFASGGMSAIAGGLPTALAGGGVNVASTLGALSGNIATTSASVAGGATLTGVGSAISTALPYVGAALAVASMLSKDDPDAMRSGNFRAGIGGTEADLQGNNWAIDQTQWFSGTEMNDSLLAFQKEVATQEKRLIANLGIYGDKAVAVSAALMANADKRYEFGMEHTDWRASNADEQIVADRLQIIANTLGITMQEVTDAMSESAVSLKDKLAALNAEKAKTLGDDLTRTVGSLDAQANFRAGLASDRGTAFKTLTLDQRIGDLQVAMAGVNDPDQWLSMANEVKDLTLSRYQEELAAIEENKAAALEQQQALRDALSGVGEAAKALLVSDLSPLTSRQKFDTAGSQFNALLSKARGGDLSAINSLAGAGQTYLGEARNQFSSSGSYTSIFNQVQGALAELGGRSVSDTTDWQAQIAAAQAKAGTALDDLNQTSLDFTDVLETKATEQIEEIRKLKLTQEQTNTLLEGVDDRIASLIQTVLDLQTALVTTTQKTGDKTARAIANLAEMRA